MGEIKSTLDLVMEKTKHLTQSREEREQQKLKEARQRIRGLIQKYQDSAMNQERFAMELDKVMKTYDVIVQDILLNELLDDLDVNRDNKPQLAMLKDICNVDITGLESVYDGYMGELQLMTQKRNQILKNDLAEKQSIAGSAVLPNVETDKIWQVNVVEINNKFNQLLTRAKAQISFK
jgi:hypothetical protein